MVRNIEAHDSESARGALVTLIEGATHNLEEGNVVSLKEVVGLKPKGDGLMIDTNDSLMFKVTKVISRSNFVIDADLGKFTAYERNGVVRLVKQPVKVKYRPLFEMIEDKEGSIDPDL